MTMTLHPITAALAQSERVAGSELLRAICDSTLAMYQDGVPQIPWAGYLAEEEGRLVGTCAFKAPPRSRAVEIAYFTFPGHEGRGVATRMATRLVQLAFGEGVDRVIAQTMPEASASTAILSRLGFCRTGEVDHPEDGLVWQWELERSSPSRIGRA